MSTVKKIKFSDIVGMLERDQMREIIGGSGGGTGSGTALSGGSTGFNTSFTGTNYGGFGGANAVGGGMYGSGSITGAGAGESSYPGSPYYNGSSSSSSTGTNNLNSTTLSNGYGGGWYDSYSNGKQTTDSLTIIRFFQFVDANHGVINNNQLFNFVNNELTAAGQQQNNQQYNLQLPGTVLNNVTVQNNYKGPSTIPQGNIINNLPLVINSSSDGGTNSGASSGTNNASWYIMPIHGSAAKPSPLQAAIMSKAVYGDKIEDEKDFGDWKVSKLVAGILYNDTQSGFKSQLYEKMGTNGKMEYCYVTAGTEPGDYGDYAADALQTVGISRQYEQSTANAKVLKALYGDQLSFAGHSLGGGMAEANARITGESATTFNAAGLSYATALLLGTGFVSDTHSYIMVNDPLNMAQMATPGLTTAGGQKHFVNQNGSSSGGHSIDSMIAALKVVPNPK